MSNPWFRLYSEIIDDEKIRLLAFEDRWHYVAILCLKNSGFLDKEHKGDMLRRGMQVKLGVNGVDLDNLKLRLMEVDLIDEDWQPHGWDSRQFKSDSSRERVRAWRERKKQTGGDEVTARNVTVTAQDTDTDTDTEEEQKKKGADAPFPEWLNRALWKEFLATRRTGKTKFTKHAEKLALSKLASLCPDGQHHEAVINQSIENGWKSFFPLKGERAAVSKLQEWANGSSDVC